MCSNRDLNPNHDWDLPITDIDISLNLIFIFNHTSDHV